MIPTPIPDQPAAQAKIVLLVDDNPTNLGVLFEALNQSGLRLLVAEDGEAALEQLQYVKPDIILMDIMMPRMDGFETCRRLQAHPETRSIPIIFMTALNETVHKLEGLSIGGVDYITKPIHPDEVLARVNIHLMLRDAQARLHEQNLALQHEVEHRQRIEQALKLLVRTVSHDLRNPVTGLLLVLKNMLNQAPAIEKNPQGPLSPGVKPLPSPHQDSHDADSIRVSRSVLERMVDSATHQLDLINSLLEAHSLEPTQHPDTTTSEQPHGLVLHRTALDFHQLVEHVVREVEPLVESHQGTLYNHVSVTLPAVHGDTSQLWRVLENLITNAIKHNPPGVVITITAEQTESYLVCEVRDDGQGIPADEQPHLFEPYHRARSQRHTPGLGLGLYLCRQIIQAHGGTIQVLSQPVDGTVFRLTVPIAMSTAGHQSMAS
ncbi:MAG: hybrid sensor histidine kinase/response regulator [Cyanobacteria bacterium P01_A01_bin.37]